MAYLNWKQEKVSVVRAENPRRVDTPEREWVLKVKFQSNHWQKLRDHFGELVSGGIPEVRLELPSGWTVFWKMRPDDGRIFLSHPEEELWIAQVSLTRSHFEELLSLQDLNFSVAREYDLSFLTNLDIEFEIEGN